MSDEKHSSDPEAPLTPVTHHDRAEDEETEMSNTATADEAVTRQQADRPASAFLSHKEAQATGESYRESEQEIRSRKRRSIFIALSILAFVVLVYAITMLKLSANI